MMTEKELIDQGYRKYSGEAIDIFFNGSVCIHSGVCVRGLHDVFDTNRRPWILADNAPAGEVAALIDSCPSGALKYIRKDK